MKKNKIVLMVGIGLLITVLLPIYNLNVPILGSFRWFWGPLIIVMSILLFPSHLFHRNVLFVLIYGLFFTNIFGLMIWLYIDEWYLRAITDDFYVLIVMVLFFNILKNKYYSKTWIILARLSFICVIITGAITILATAIVPDIVRISYSTGSEGFEAFDYYQRFGFGGYGYITGIVALFPMLIYMIKSDQKTWLPKGLIIILLVFFYFVLLGAQIFANIIVATIIIALSFVGVRNLYKSILYIIILSLSIYVIPKKSKINMLESISVTVGEETIVGVKVKDLAQFYSNPEFNKQAKSTQVSSRASRYPALFEAFLNAPLKGDGSYISKFDEELENGAHLYWMSRLTLWGVVGFIFYIIMLRRVFLSVINIFDNQFKYYYYLSVLSIVVLGLMKNLTGRETYALLLIVIPGLYMVFNRE